MTVMRAILIFLLVAGCGVVENNEEPDAKAKDSSTTEGSHSSLPDKPTSPLPPSVPQVTIKGYVSPLDLTVDGVSYGASGSEAFFTAQYERLRAESDDAGYGNYDLRIVGNLGLSDFSDGLVVLGASESFAFEKPVLRGAFSVTLPADDGSPLTIRAVRRIEVQLIPSSRSKPKIVWCFNLLSDAVLDPTSQNSIVLNVFTTALTRYACSSHGSLSLPDALLPKTEQSFHE